MAKTTIYLRVGKKEGGRKPYKVEASSDPNYAPLLVKGGYNKPDAYLPTVAFGLTLDLPDELFETASKVIGEINIAAKDARIAATVEVPGTT